MKSYKRYLQKIENFQMRAIDPFQDILVKGNYRFGDIEELDSLGGFVLEEMGEAAPGSIKLKLKRLREENNRLVDFDKNYPELIVKSRKELLRPADLRKYFPLFNAPDEEEIVIKPEYIKTVYQSVLARQKSLLELIDKVEDLLVGS